jgi:ATP-dependent DNA helicase RecQ
MSYRLYTAVVLATTQSPASRSADPVLAAVKRYWGYDALRPLQDEAIGAGIDHRDSLVVLPTGGGKSLCYQVPPVVAGRMDVVVSPLISLMKDQVDALKLCGYPAAALHSGLSPAERRVVEMAVLRKELRLVFVSPERLLTPSFLNLLRRVDVRAFAIDEAHCISQWGHDFRPEYRQLAGLRQHFPRASIHAYTATATPRVRDDIVQQLRLKEPRVIVGTFDRPNLVYRVIPRHDTVSQVVDAVRRHKDEACIVYCISRKETEGLAASLRSAGIKAAPYHAGLDASQRRHTQDEFAAEKLDVVVATVAFGMGIDRSNVRCVIHAAMPKSVEHYQQESGRTGRDGLEAECILLYSPSDLRRWESVIRSGAEESKASEEVVAAQVGSLREMAAFCSSRTCRHAALSRYFGQEYAAPACGACDVCLKEGGTRKDATGIARRILAAVHALREGFGVNHVVDFLAGARTEQLRRFGHTEMPDYGALRGQQRDLLKRTVLQLVEEGVLERTPGERPVLKLNGLSRAVLEGQQPVLLPDDDAIIPPAPASPDAGDLFQALRALRRRLAEERGVPAYVILGDATLQEIAAARPTSLTALANIKGIGQKKLDEFGVEVLKTVRAYVLSDPKPRPGQAKWQRAPGPMTEIKSKAFALFRRGDSVEDVAAKIGRARSTTAQYLAEFILQEKPSVVTPWVTEATYGRVEAVIARLGGDYLRPLFEALNQEVSYDDIRVVLYHLRAHGKLEPGR